MSPRISIALAEITNAVSPWLMALIFLIALVFFARVRQRPQNLAGRSVAVSAGLRTVALLVILLMSLGWTYTTTTTSQPKITLLIDDSGSMAQVDTEVSRLRQVQDVLLRAGLLAELEDRCQINVALVSGNNLAPAKTLRQQIEQIQPIHETTPLGERLIELSGAAHTPSADAILVFSDGKVTSERGLPAVSAASAGTPLIGIGVGSSYVAADVALQDAAHEDVAHVNDIVRVGVQVVYQGASPVESQLILADAETNRELARQIIELRPDTTRRVWMQYRPTMTGVNRLAVRVQSLQGESNLNNNTLNVALWIHDKPIRVLLVQAYPSYEFMRLKGLFGRGRFDRSAVDDRAIQIRTLLQHADPEYVGTDPFAIRALPDTVEGLDEFDVIILGDVDPEFLTPVDAGNISRFVSERGGGLVFICGPRFMPNEFARGPLAELMPLQPTSATPAGGRTSAAAAHKLSVSQLGSAWPHLWLDNADDWRQAWRDLPAIYWLAPAGPLRPSAHSLVETQSGSQLSQPVISTIDVGLGRVVMHRTDSTWRWKQANRGTPFAMYWQQTMRYLAARRTVTDRPLLTSDRPAYHRGATVRLTARADTFAQRSVDQPVDQVADQVADRAHLMIELKSREGRVETIPLRSSAAPIRSLTEVKLPHLPPDSYEATLVRNGVELSATAFRIEERTIETLDPAPDLRALRDVAEASGGVYMDVGECQRLLSEVGEELLAARTLRKQVPLWNTPWLAMTFLAVVVAGWLYRRD